ncbi:GATA transcription factor 25-like [Miscanthus floridulus]|uniref:GATA transcription factor 25-like n=1 Tax=Miscanthus floridulus TaxID=154761 RepID=UPI00345A1F87
MHQIFSFYTNPPSLALTPQTHQRDSRPKAMFHPSSSSPPNYSDLSMHHAVGFSSAVPTAPTEIPRGGFFHGNGGLLALPNVAPPPYPSSLPSYYIHSNINSHFLPIHLQLSEQLSSNATFSCSSPSASACQLPLPHVPSSPSSSSGDLLEFRTGAMRRVFSTGDLQVMNVAASPPPPPLSGDPHGQDAGVPFTQKVGRYSAEERKQKIERYRTKRNQRNFHKKITYACRKTLADSRPRVQGRFARNAETEAEAAAGHEREASDNYSYEHCHYSDLTTTSSCCYDTQCRESGKTTTFDDGKWWWEAPVAAPAAANGHHRHHQYQQQLLDFDIDMDMDGDDLWASVANMCSGT